MNRTKGIAGFTLMELLIAIAIIALLASLILASLSRAATRAKTAQCLNNLAQWNLTLALYMGENGDAIPRRGQGVQPLADLTRAEDWFNALPPLANLPTYQTLANQGKIPKPGDNTIFVCPTAKPTQNTNFLPYAMNIYLSPWIRPLPHHLPEIPRPASLAFMADGACAYSATVPSALAYSVPARHGSKANIAFLDGHT
ncbi:MAG: N-terminal cleavage protein [Pedosphaera sp.]|nr:N-terminal cleavage protein [Pedosphaera sp.]